MNLGIVKTNGGQTLITVDGTRFKNELDAIAHSEKLLAEVTQKLGREPTAQEWSLQRVEPATDSRSFEQKGRDEKFAVKKSTELRGIDKAIADQERLIADKKKYEGLSREEARLLDLQNVRDGKEAEQREQLRKEAHIKGVEGKLRAVDKMIRQENWNPESDQAFREKLRQTRMMLLEPDADPKALAYNFAEIDAALVQRQQAKEAEALEQLASAEATLARSREEIQTISESPTLSNEPLDSMIQGDVVEGLRGRLNGMLDSMIQKNVSDDVWNEVSTARDNLTDANPQAIEAANNVLAKYAE